MVYGGNRSGAASLIWRLTLTFAAGKQTLIVTFVLFHSNNDKKEP